MKPIRIERNHNPNIIIGSYGTTSTGINLKKLYNVVLCSPTKSTIRLLQSIGRGLRKLQDKTLVVIDISDNLCYKSKTNFTYTHFIHRYKLYKSENFKFKMIKKNIGD